MKRFDIRLLYPVALFTGLIVISLAGCELIASVDRNRITETGGGGAAPGGMGGMATSTSTTGGGGTGGGMCDLTACVSDDICEDAACDPNDSSMCGPAVNQPVGTACTDTAVPDSQVCNGMGDCVECNGDNDCTSPETCDVSGGNICVPPTCSNNMVDNGETDVDCGNITVSMCGRCDDGELCNDFDDCTSRYCDTNGGGGGGGNAPSGTCSACTDIGDCQTGSYCNGSNDCVPQLVDGTACTLDDECVNGNCIEGVCCDTPCGGTCQSCLATENGGSNGTCGNVTVGRDPDNECTADQNTATCNDDNCDGNGACQVVADTTPCSDGTFCNGTETCTGGTCGNSSGNPCSGQDVGPSCNDSCSEQNDNCTANDADNTDCDDGMFCNGADTCQSGSCTNAGNPCPGHNTGPSCDDSCDEGNDDCAGPDANGTACDESAGGAPGTCTGNLTEPNCSGDT